MEPTEYKSFLAIIAMLLFAVIGNSFVRAQQGDDGRFVSGRIDRAEVRLDEGKTAEIVLSKAQGMTSYPVVVRNLPYEGATGNEGFIIMASEIEAYRVGSKPF